MHEKKPLSKWWLLGLVGFLIVGCSLPKMPNEVSWGMQVNFPLATQTYWLWELAEDDSLFTDSSSTIGMTSDSALFFRHVQRMDPVFPADSLWWNIMEYRINKLIDHLRIPVDMDESGEVTLGTLNPAFADSHGSVVDVASFPFTYAESFPFGDFSEACVDSGQVDMQLTNTLPFALNGFSIRWVGAQDVFYLFNGNLAAETETTFVSPFSGECIGESMQLEITGTAAGGMQLQIDSTEGLEWTISVGTIKVHYYIGRIPRQVLEIDSTFRLEQRHEVSEAVIASGSVIITATNESIFSDSFYVVLEDFYTPDGHVLQTERYYIPPGQFFEITLDLAEITFRLPDPARQEIRGRLVSVLLPTEEIVIFEGGIHRVYADIRADSFTFHYFSGMIDTIKNFIEQEVTEIEQPPEGWESIHPATVDLFLTIQSSLEAPDYWTERDAFGNVDLFFRSTREGREIGSVTCHARINAHRDTTVKFTGLAELVREFPEFIHYSGTVSFTGPIILYDTTNVIGKIELRAPMMFTLDDGEIPGDVEKVDMEPVEDLEDVSLNVRLWNALPISGTLSLIAAFDSAAVEKNSGLPAETLFTVSLPQAELISERVNAPGYQEIVIAPAESSYDFFREPPFYIRSELFIRGSHGDTLIAYGGDYVRFIASGKVTFRISSEGNE